MDEPSTSNAQAPPIRRLFVRNIGYRKRRATIVKTYTDFFSKFGPVEYFDVVYDHIRKTPKGYGFVTFRHPEDAQKALAASAEDLITGGPEYRELTVYPATQKIMTVVKTELRELKQKRDALRKLKIEILRSPTSDRISTLDEEESQKPKEVPKEEEVKDAGESSEEEEEEKEPTKEKSVQNPEAQLVGEDEPTVSGPICTKTMSDLNNEILMAIFDYLPIRERFRCSFVCSRWNSLMELVWGDTKRLSFKESFCLWGGQLLDCNILFKILRKCPDLKELDLYQTATTLDDKSCDIIGRCCPSLEKLVIRDTTLNKYCVTSIGKLCSSLKYINFAKCANVTEKGLWGLFNLRPDLETLILSNCELITGRCFYLLNNLTYLDLAGCSPALNASFSRLAQNCSTKLKVLIAPPISSEGLNFVCHTFSNLVRFEVDSTDNEPVLHGAVHLAALTQLETLVFRPEFSDLNDETFHHITANLPNLRSLTMFGNDNTTDLSAIALPHHCPNLKLVNLEGFKFGDPAVKAFAQLENLESCEVSGSLVTDEGAYHLMLHAPKLEILGLNSCMGISLETLRNAFELVKQNLANQNLLVCYTNCRIRITEFKDKEDVTRYESKDIWGSDEEYNEYPEGPFYVPDRVAEVDAGAAAAAAVRDDYDDYDDYEPRDDYIVDGDFDSEEEELHQLN